MIKDVSWRPYQVECFKAIHSAFKEKGLKRQLVVQATGCHAKGTPILMYNGAIKNVEDISVNELIMGDDSTPRKVQYLCRGREQMVRITPIKGEPFIVNLSHILSLRKTPTPNKYFGMEKFINISVKDYLQKSKNFKHLYKLYRVSVNFENNFYKSFKKINPYLLGFWLGDGTTNSSTFTSNEPEIDKYFYDNFNVTSKYHKGNGLFKYSLDVKVKLFDHNGLYKELRQFLSKDGVKYITTESLCWKYEQRLELLAGLIDSDGSLTCNCYDFVNKNYSIANAVVFLARSLGLSAYIIPVKKKCVNTNIWGDYFRVSVSGNTNIIPCKVSRKKSNPRKQIKDVLTTGFSVELLPEDDYYGFELDGNHLYCMGDFTVTHNTGKRLGAVNVSTKFENSLFLAHSEELIEQAVKDMEKFHGFMNVGVIKGSRFEIDKKVVIASPQTLTHRLDRINPKHFKLIQIDEAHRYLARTWVKAVKHFEPLLSVGWTATPYRLDGLSLADLFDDITFEYNIAKAIEDGYLCELDGIRIKTEIDLSKVHRQAGDFKVDELSNLVDTKARNELVVESYQKYCEDRQAIGFCVDVKHCQNLKAEFIAKGIPCEILVADENVCPDRKGVNERFRNGSTKVLLNVQILIEGWDYSDVGAVLMVRPTQSLTFYMQSIGRGTRLKSPEFRTKYGVNNCKILDFVDSSGKHNLINTWTLDKGKTAKEKCFVTSEKRDKLLATESERRNAKIDSKVKQDGKINLLKLPELKTYGGEWTSDWATEAQLEYLKKLGLWEADVEYTKGMCSELISNEPAQYWQLKKLSEWGYDVSGTVLNGQFQKIKQKMISDHKYDPNFKI